MNFIAMRPKEWLHYWMRACQSSIHPLQIGERENDPRWEVVRLEGERFKYRMSEDRREEA